MLELLGILTKWNAQSPFLIGWVTSTIVLQYTSMIFVIVYQGIAERRMPALRHVPVVLGAFAGMALFFMGSLSSEGMLGNILAIASGASFGLQFYLNSRPGPRPSCHPWS